jgi:hypothetical protein
MLQYILQTVYIQHSLIISIAELDESLYFLMNVMQR